MGDSILSLSRIPMHWEKLFSALKLNFSGVLILEELIQIVEFIIFWFEL